jgi:hypothetical protein
MLKSVGEYAYLCSRPNNQECKQDSV